VAEVQGRAYRATGLPRATPTYPSRDFH